MGNVAWWARPVLKQLQSLYVLVSEETTTMCNAKWDGVYIHLGLEYNTECSFIEYAGVIDTSSEGHSLSEVYIFLLLTKFSSCRPC